NAHHFGSMAEGGYPFIWYRQRTNASVEWVEDNLGWGWHCSPELKTIIQELVNQEDWVANNYLALLFIAKVQETVKKAVFHSWNFAAGEIQNHEHAAKIHITYTDGASAYYHGLKVQGEGELALCDVDTNPLRIRKGGTTYGLELVATDDPNASRIRVKTGAGVKAIRKYS
ncbi:unnamed protein product, partial [marine sediment metagenome]